MYLGHVSWLNRSEVFFSVVRRKVLTPNDLHDLADVQVRLMAFQDPYNFHRTAVQLDLHPPQPRRPTQSIAVHEARMPRV